MSKLTTIITILILIVLPISGFCQQANLQEENKNIIRLHLEHLRNADRKLIVADWAEDGQNFGAPASRQVITELFDDIYTTFPDYRFDLVDMIAEGDIVSIRVKASGTHLGTMKKTIRDLNGIPPTQKHFEVNHIHWYKLKDGKIVDHWAVRDDLKMMQQLGLIQIAVNPTK